MKTMKRYLGLYYLLSIILLAATLGIYFYRADILLGLPFLNWLALPLLAIMVFSPWGSQSLVSPSTSLTTLPPSQWFAKILNLQLSLFLLYFSITQFTHYFSIAGQAPKTLLTDSLHTLLFKFGIYPWPLIAIFAIAFALSAYNKEQDSYLSNITPLFDNKKRETLEVIIKTMGRAVTLIAIATTLVIITFIFTTTATSLTHFKELTGFTAASVGVAFLMLFFTIRRNDNQFLMQINKKRPLLGILLTVLIWVIVLTLASVVIHYTGNMKGQPPWMVVPLLNKGWLLHWELFSEYWWLLFTPIIAILIARFSYGYSIRGIILATLLFPLLLTALIKMITLPMINIDINQAPLWLVQIAAILGFLSLISLMYQKKHLPLTMLTYLPKAGNDRPRNEDIYHKRLKKMCGLVFYFFIPAGFFVIAVFMALSFIPMIVIIIAVYLQILKSFR